MFKSYVGQEPQDFHGYYWRGRVYKDLAQYQDASSALENALKFDGNDYDVRYNVGVVLAHLKRYGEAAQQLEVAQLNPAGADVDYQLAGVLRQLNDQKGRERRTESFSGFEAS